MISGVRYSIFRIFGGSPWRYQALHDGNSCFELIGADDWSVTTFPQIEHCSDVVWHQARAPMESKEASDSDLWSE